MHVEGLSEPVIASRSEASILRDVLGTPQAQTQSREQQELLRDIRDTVAGINPLLRSIIRDQGNWDLDRLEERIQETLDDETEHPSFASAH